MRAYTMHCSKEKEAAATEREREIRTRWLCINFQHIEQEYHELREINHVRERRDDSGMWCGILEHIVT